MKKLSNIINLCDKNRLVISYVAFLIGVSISMFLVAPNTYFFNSAVSISDKNNMHEVINDDFNTIVSVEFLARIAYVIPIVTAIIGGVVFIDKRGLKRQEETLSQMKNILFGSGTEVDPGHIGSLKRSIDNLCITIKKLEDEIDNTRTLVYEKTEKHEFCKDVHIREKAD